MSRDQSLWVVPDCHATPEYDGDDLGRFEALGDFLRSRAKKGDALVCLGDFADMPSLSAYDKGKRSAEGRRYNDDVRVAMEAARAAFGGLKGVESHMLMGNHEDRIDRAASQDPALHGKLDVSDLGYERLFDHVHPFLKVVGVRGVAFSHYFASGVMGRPIGGASPANSLLNKLHCSAVAGHSHLLDVAVQTRPTGEKVWGVVAGCYTHPDYSEGWCASTRHMWWSGIVRLSQRHGRDGWKIVGVEAIGAEEILR